MDFGNKSDTFHSYLTILQFYLAKQGRKKYTVCKQRAERGGIILILARGV